MSAGKRRRVALVTGSTSGIGRAIAERLGSDGYEVALHSRTSVDAGRELAAAMPGASYTQADLASETQCRDLVHQVIDTHGRLDVLINNAGINALIPHNDLPAASPALWREMYAVNVIAPWVLITAAEEALRRAATDTGSACILNISSHAGVRPKGGSIPYAVSKAALNHMTRLLARTLGPAIRVNALAPGLTDTPMTADWDTAHELWESTAPMRRGAAPAEIAATAALLVDSSYLTGEVILADGGLNLT